MDVGQAHAGMDGEVVDALFALLDQRVLVHFPVELDGIAVYFLQRLIDRHGADGDRRVADDPFARGEEVTADDHRLKFSVVDVRRNDRAPARDFAAYEFRRVESGYRCAKALTIG